MPAALLKVINMAGLRAYEGGHSVRNLFAIEPSRLYTSGFTILQSITVAGAALEFNQLPSFNLLRQTLVNKRIWSIKMKHHKNIFLF